MSRAPIPNDETERLAALHAYDVLDTAAEPQYDDLVDLAAHICEAPIALISLVDEKRQWFKARYGLEARETNRDVAFCAHAILQPDTFVVEDALEDARFADNPLVNAEPKIRFYAGTPLISAEGHALGTLCVIDRVPRRLTPDQEKSLRILGRHVMGQLELRRRTLETRKLRLQNAALAAQVERRDAEVSGGPQRAGPVDEHRLRDAERARQALLSVLEDQRRVEEQLRASEARYRHLFEQNPAPMLIYERGSLRLLAVNEAFCRHYGYSKTEASALVLTDLYPDDEKQRVTRLAARLHGYADVGEWHHRRGDGGLITIVATSHDTLFEGRQARIAVITDISERKRAEQALQESEERLRMALESANQGLYDLDLTTGKAVVSPQYARMLGYEPGGFEESNAAWRARLHPEDHDRVIGVLEDYLHQRIADYRVEYRQKTRAGDWTWILSHGRIQEWDTNGKPIRMLGTHTDITLLKETEAALAERNRRLIEAEAQAHMGHWWLDGVSGEAYWADEIFHIMGLPKAGEAGPDLLRKSVSAADWPQVERSLQDAMAGISEHDMQYHIVRPDKSVRVVRCRARRVVDPDGQHPRLQGTFQDITQLEEMRQRVEKARDELESRVRERTAELEAANRDLETFTYSVSHDLKAPLRGIDGYSRLLLEDHLEQLDEEGQLFLRNVRHGVGRMSQLIEDLLAYSRMERRSMDHAEVDLRRVVDDVIKERHEVLSEERVKLRVDLAADTARGDSNGLTLVLRNLLDNALKFSRDSAEAKIDVTSRRDGSEVVIEVSDNGIGFDMRFHDRIFDIFQRLQREEDYPGTGIGLAIVRKAVQRMGGRIHADSSPGQGASFTIVLPE